MSSTTPSTPAVVAVLVSTSGPLPQSTWTSHLNSILPSLQSALGTTSTPAQRFLDLPSSAQRVMELLLPIPAPLTQPQCTSTVYTLLPLLPSGLHLTLVPLTPLHRLHPSFSRSTPKLACFDMDSTLVQQEVIDELARRAGVYSACAAITEAAMRGDAPYADPVSGFRASLAARVRLLNGVPGSVWEDLRRDVVSFTPGAMGIVACLASVGFRTAVLSGGFSVLAEWVRETLGLDRAEANWLATDEEGRLTGELVPGKEIVDGGRKRVLLRRFAEEWAVEKGLEVAVGDGSNDLPMMGEAGLGVAFNAKPKVQERAPAVVNGRTLLDVLYLLGWTEEEIREVVDKLDG